MARNLASPQTDLAGFFRGLENYNSALVPVAQTQATLFGNLDTTFRALAGVAVPFLQETISDTPPSFEATINGSPVIRPFLLSHRQAVQRPAARGRHAAAVGAGARAGVRDRDQDPARDRGALDQRTLALARKLESYGATPAVQQGLDRLTLTLSRLQPPLAFLTPAQSTCNYVTLFLRNTSSVLGDRVTQGGLLRFVQVAIDRPPGRRVRPVVSSPTPDRPAPRSGRCTPIRIRTPTRPANRRDARPATSSTRPRAR